DLRSDTGEARKKIFDRLLDFTALGPFTERLAGKLSGGMKQKLGLACTLVGDPKVLLLDEPFSALDPALRQEMLSLVADVCEQQQLTLLMVSHSVEDAARIAPRSMVVAE
ncbi:ATP-binding cassette domain-containing protein, partial [Acinetobacter baumannii]|uniref:ATP-binding cassette domain-containing protein n=1 Tax=Acinetobacter baumannii TaxID=470 RepID=UPI003C761F09